MKAKTVSESLYEAFGQKDLVRMEDIRTKAGGDEAKELALAQTQAKLIGKAEKAAARAEAAEKVFGPDHPVTLIFSDRAAELGGGRTRGQASKGVLAPVKAPAGKGERLEREFDRKKLLPSERIGGEDVESGGSFSKGGDAFQKMGIGRFSRPIETSNKHSYNEISILPIGWVDIGSGESKYFNIYETWPDSIAELWVTSDGKHRLIFTSGEPRLKIGQTADFRHDQTWKEIGRYWKFIDYLPVKDLMELVRVYGKNKFPGYTYK
jgi:hypothetical protein